jgi:hypothetical protein
MHYKDGTPAKIGDLVRGIGYNVKHEIQGIVVGLKQADSCNITIAHVVSAGKGHDGCIPIFDGEWSQTSAFNPVVSFVRIEREYGEAKSFEKIA